MDYRKIYLNEIPVDGLVLNIRLDSGELDLEVDNAQAEGEIVFKGMLNRYSERYILSGQLTGTWVFCCDRCLKSFHYPVKSDILMHYTEAHNPGRSPTRSPESEMEEPDEVVIDHINVQQALVEQMILQIPMKALCSENCKGLCTQCGEDLNIRQCDCKRIEIDPRLSKLKKLLEK